MYMNLFEQFKNLRNETKVTIALGVIYCLNILLFFTLNLLFSWINTKNSLISINEIHLLSINYKFKLFYQEIFFWIQYCLVIFIPPFSTISSIYSLKFEKNRLLAISIFLFSVLTLIFAYIEFYQPFFNALNISKM